MTGHAAVAPAVSASGAVAGDAATMPVVRARGLSVGYGATIALEDVDIDVAPGEVVALLGRSGSGKSTLMRALTGMAPATARELSVAGRDVLTLRPSALRGLRSDVGYVFQHFNLVPTLSALTNVLTGGLHRAGPLNTVGLFSRTQRALALELLARVGLEGKARQRARTLSGGQQQRVAIARALMQDPVLILADEPVASLDPRLAGSVLSLLREVAAERGIPVVVSLHVVDLARQYTDRVVGLHDGRVVFDARVEDLDDLAVERIYAQEEEIDD